MSEKKKGGARLDKNAPAHQNAAHHPAPKQKVDPTQKPAPVKKQKTIGTGLKVLLIVLAVIAALLLGLLIWYKGFFAKLPAQPSLPPISTIASPTADPWTGEIPSKEPSAAELAGRKKDFYTFLLVGKDTGGGGNTDTLMLVSYDVKDQNISVMSIPRDTMVDAKHPDPDKKINGVYNLCWYYADPATRKPGIEYLKDAVGDMLGFTPDFYVMVNWEAFGRLVDAIGGVDFNVPFDMKYADPLQNLYIDQPAGYRHLWGSDAMQVVRWRHNNDFSAQYADADLGRIRTQQALMKEIFKQCLKFENVTKISEFAQIFADEVETDLTLGNLVAFAERAILGGMDSDHLTFMTLPIEGVYIGAESYVQAKPEETLAVINERFNPYTEDLSLADMNIMAYDAEAGHYYTTSGKIIPAY